MSKELMDCLQHVSRYVGGSTIIKLAANEHSIVAFDCLADSPHRMQLLLAHKQSHLLFGF